MALAKSKTSALSNSGVACALIDPATQVPNGIRFYVLGSDSKEYQRLIRLQEVARLEKQKKARGIYFPTPEESEENALNLLTSLTMGWDEDVVDAEGKVTAVRKEIELEEGEYVPFSIEAAKAIYAELGYKWIREQVDAFIGDRRNFLPK
ncbi:MAG: hypothetical protein HXX17_11980 [Geobacteraceae bacterium]|nr:hypothetical protein [Geobacteraceae bacterium]